MTYGGGFGAYGGLPAGGFGGFGGLATTGYGMPSYGMGMPSYGMSSYAAPAVHAPMVSSSISAPVATSVSIPSGSISAPMSLPTSNMFSGYTSTPFMPASYYNPSTFGAPTTAFGGMPLP